jgi:hypothetical protein
LAGPGHDGKISKIFKILLILKIAKTSNILKTLQFFKASNIFKMLKEEPFCRTRSWSWTTTPT